MANLKILNIIILVAVVMTANGCVSGQPKLQPDHFKTGALYYDARFTGWYVGKETLAKKSKLKIKETCKDKDLVVLFENLYRQRLSKYVNGIYSGDVDGRHKAHIKFKCVSKNNV